MLLGDAGIGCNKVSYMCNLQSIFLLYLECIKEFLMCVICSGAAFSMKTSKDESIGDNTRV